MLQYTFHPLIDVGAATIAANAGKSKLEDLDASDIDAMVEYIEKHYFVYPLQSFIWSMFPNSGYTQPSVRNSNEKKAEYVQTLTYSHYQNGRKLPEKCVFCDNFANTRAFREHLPLAGSIHTTNFYADGDAGIPVCSLHLLCIQVFFLGGAICEGRSLIVHSDNEKLTYHFAKRFLTRNRRMVALLELQGGGDKLIGYKYPKTVIVQNLVELERERENEEQIGSITAYWLTNYGTKADIEIFHLPMQIVRFLRQAQAAKYRVAWDTLVHRAWHDIGSTKSAGEELHYRRNYLYEDLFELPEGVRRFVRRFFLRQPIRGIKIKRDHPLLSHSLQNEVKLVAWDLLELFLKEMMNMDKIRIEAIKRMGDYLTFYVQEHDARFFVRLFRARHYNELSLELLKAKRKAAEIGTQSYSFNDFIEVFEEGEDLPYPDWSLARDLLLVRMIDNLQAANWFTNHPDVLTDSTSEEESDG